MRQIDLKQLAAEAQEADGCFNICEFALPGVHPAAQSKYDRLHWQWFQEAFGTPIAESNQVQCCSKQKL